MPCCHIPNSVNLVFPASLVPDAQRFSIYVGDGNPSTPSPRTSVLTSALHFEMKLWPPFGRLPKKYRINDAQRNSWGVMLVVMGRDTFTTLEKNKIFDQLCNLNSPTTPNCILEQFDDWILDAIISLRSSGIDPSRNPQIAGTAKRVSALASFGRSQKLVNVFLKYELCWQVAGQWQRGNFATYTPRIAHLNSFLCALHAPVDSILIESLLSLPVGQYLKDTGILKPRQGSPLIKQSSNGVYTPWSKLDCLRTYYGFQLMLRRIAMETWPKSCACSNSPSKAIQQCVDWFVRKHGNLWPCKESDWIDAVLNIPPEVIDKTINDLKTMQTVKSSDIEKIDESDDVKVVMAPGDLRGSDLIEDENFIPEPLDPADKAMLRSQPIAPKEAVGTNSPADSPASEIDLNDPFVIKYSKKKDSGLKIFDQYSDGFCPQCLLVNRRVAMKLNDSDFWECPDCHLQAHSRSKGMFAIMHKRGKCAEFRNVEATASVIGWVLSPAAAEAPFKPQGGFNSEAELRIFLSTVT